jgi:hypothetical protein
MRDIMTFWRVEDDSSHVQTTRGRGARAADVKSRVDFGARRGVKRDQLTELFDNHLNWSNRTDTPFISAYTYLRAAYEEAMRRKRAGKENVRIIGFDMDRAGRRVEYRNVRKLAWSLGYWIPKKAWRNSEFEYIFLHGIPASAVTGVMKL